MKLLLVIGGVALAIAGCDRSTSTSAPPAKAPNPDLVTVDEYLKAWSLLVRMPSADDVKVMAERLKAKEPEFQKSLIALIEHGDSRAPGRVVYSQVIQIGSFVDFKSPLGVAIHKMVGEDCPVTNSKGDRLYFAGDLYLWWEANRAKYQPYSPLLEWERSDTARKSVIPMYQRQAGLRSKVDLGK